MTRRARPPLKLKLTDGLVDVSYICERCGTETKRSIREKESRSGSSLIAGFRLPSSSLVDACSALLLTPKSAELK
jgi:hypothetical protein